MISPFRDSTSINNHAPRQSWRSDPRADWTMKRHLILLTLLMIATWIVGCRGKKEATPQKMEEFRQQHIKNSDRERSEG